MVCGAGSMKTRRSTMVLSSLSLKPVKLSSDAPNDRASLLGLRSNGGGVCVLGPLLPPPSVPPPSPLPGLLNESLLFSPKAGISTLKESLLSGTAAAAAAAAAEKELPSLPLFGGDALLEAGVEPLLEYEPRRFGLVLERRTPSMSADERTLPRLRCVGSPLSLEPEENREGMDPRRSLGGSSRIGVSAMVMAPMYWWRTSSERGVSLPALWPHSLSSRMT